MTVACGNLRFTREVLSRQTHVIFKKKMLLIIIKMNEIKWSLPTEKDKEHENVPLQYCYSESLCRQDLQNPQNTLRIVAGEL